MKKVMLVVETVYDSTEKFTHSFAEKCHTTFITDYVPTQEEKCETSFQKNCQITYKPTTFEENVEICDEPLKKICNDKIVGEVVCQTHYETTCETRHKEVSLSRVSELVEKKKGVWFRISQMNRVIWNLENHASWKQF